MIVWLSKGLENVWFRIFMSFFIFSWLIYIAWMENRHYREVSIAIANQFEGLRSDHIEMRALMTRNTAKFSGVVERNTEAVKKTAEIVRDVHDDGKPSP